MSIAEAISTLQPGEELTAGNFDRLATFIHDYSGIKMPSNKRTMIEGRLRRRMRVVEIDDINDYCDYLFEQGGLDVEVVHLIDAVTTNKTDFFREPMHFDFLVRETLPAICATGRRDIKVWSAASSTGEEPYTLAMVLDEFCSAHAPMNFSVLGTDICTTVLEQAVAGIYSHALIEPVSMARRQRYLTRAKDDARDDVRITPRLRAKVAFARLNLMDESYPVSTDMDVIFCRNILIYFDKITQAKVLNRLCRHLRPGGTLFLGHSESVAGVDLPVRQIANTVFQRQ